MANAGTTPDALARRFVWGTWATMLSLAMFFALYYRSTVPAYVGLDFILEVYAGAQPMSLAWLWEQYYEYRCPLQKLVLAVLWHVSGRDILLTQVLNVLCLGGAAALLMASARRLRGRTRASDAVFPVLLLAWGQYESLFIYYFNPGLQVLLVCGIICLMSRDPGVPRAGTAIASGFLITLLPLCGISGQVVLPPLVAWLGWAGFSLARTGERRNRVAGASSLLLAVAAVVITALSFIGYHLQRNLAPNTGLIATLRCLTEYLSMGFSRLGRTTWPWSAAAVGFAWLAAALPLVIQLRSRPEERFRTAGLLAVSGGLFLHALALAWGRASIGPGAGFVASRYVTYAALLLGAVYLLWTALERQNGSPGIQRVLLAAAFISAPFDLYSGLGMARARWLVTSAIERDAAAGLSATDLAARYWPYLNICEKEGLADLRLMEKAGIGPFREPAAARKASPPRPGRGGRILGTHSGRVRCVRFAPRGSLLASCGDDGTIRLWKAATGRPGPILRDHARVVSAIAFAPDGKTIASADWDGTVRLWDPATGRLLLSRKVDGGALTALSFAPDGKRLAVGAWDGLVRIWDRGLGFLPRSLVYHEGEVLGLAFQPRGNLLVTAGWAGTARIAWWDTKTLTMASDLPGQGCTVTSAAFCPNGTVVATAGWNGTVALWPSQGAAPPILFAAHDGVVSSVTFSPRGDILATGGWDGKVRTWGTSDGLARLSYEGHGGPVSSVAFSGDGRTLASGGWDGTVRIWRVTGPTAGWEASPR